MRKREELFRIKWEDLTKQYFRAGGKGGQKQNKTSSGVRLIHEPSGARGEARDTASRARNEMLALERLRDDPRLRTWAMGVLYRIRYGVTIDEAVDEAMRDTNLRVEVRGDDGKWQESE